MRASSERLILDLQILALTGAESLFLRSLAAQSFCGASRIRAPLAPPRMSVPRKVEAEKQYTPECPPFKSFDESPSEFIFRLTFLIR